jgi:Glycosyl hydrolases family 25
MIEFPDVSHHQGDINLVGASAVIAKASQGTGFTDPTYALNRAQAARIGALFIAYHWLDTSDAVAQARHAYSVVGPEVPLMIDDEQNVITVTHTLAFVSAYRALGGIVRLEYAPRWVWSKSGQPDLRPLAAAGLLIVSSSYPAVGYTDDGPGWQPYGGVTPTIWQFTDRQPFNGKRVDFNAFRGTVDQMRAQLQGGTAMTTGSDVWGFAINSPSLSFNGPASEWLKFAVSGARTAEAILAAVTANAAADATRDAAMLAAIQAVTQGGGSVDTAAVIAAIQAARDDARQEFGQLRTDLSAAQAEVTQLRSQLAAGTRAEADALAIRQTATVPSQPAGH